MDNQLISRMMLQWGHASSRVETKRLAMYGTEPNPASMGPRVFTRGNPCRCSSIPLAQTASMGPRVFTRGNLDFPAIKRDESNASMGPRVFTRGNWQRRPDSRRGKTLLQWGHASSRVETHLRHRRDPPGSASMGPRVFTRGNLIFILEESTR